MLTSAASRFGGNARVIEGDDQLIEKLMPEGYKARPEQVILFTVSAWDENCSQHIPQRFEAADVASALAERDKRYQNIGSGESNSCARRREEHRLNTIAGNIATHERMA